MKDTIRTLHPDKKQGVNISKEKYQVIRQAILSTLSAGKRNDFYEIVPRSGKRSEWKF